MDLATSRAPWVRPSNHTYTAAMTYTYTVEVADAEFTVSDSADVVISEDLPPIADAGEDLETAEDVPVLFDGHESSDDVEIVDFAWTIVELSDTVHVSMTTVYYTFDDPGVYTVELVVTDSLSQTSAPDTVIVTVTDATAPGIVATVTSPVDMGGTVDLRRDRYDGQHRCSRGPGLLVDGSSTARPVVD